MLQMRETFVNETKGYQFGETDWYEPYTDNRGALFLSLQREYGRCVSTMYRDRQDGTVVRVGWVFQKRMEYEGARTRDDTYIREAWVELRTVPDTEEE